MTRSPMLGLLALGTNGSDGLQPGIHLRWQFAKELGFPDGGFALFRRDAKSQPTQDRFLPSYGEPCNYEDHQWSLLAEIPLEFRKWQDHLDAIERRYLRGNRDRVARYGGARLAELVAMAAEVVSVRGAPQSSVRLSAQATSTCSGIESYSLPFPDFSCLDLLLMAAIDPVIARLLQMYWIDTQSLVPTDYRVVGNWGKNRFWNLGHSSDYESLQRGKRFALNCFAHEGLIYLSSVPPTVVEEDHRMLSTRKALAFVPRGKGDWRMPHGRSKEKETRSKYLSSKERASRAELEIHFVQSVGVVQVYLSCDVRGVEAIAFDSNGVALNANPQRTRLREDVLQIQADQPEKRIARVVLRGARFALHRVAWTEKALRSGKFCAYAFHLDRKTSLPVPSVQGVRAEKFAGVARNEDPCAEYLEGAADEAARLCIGIGWDPPSEKQLLSPECPVRYEVEREVQGGQWEFRNPDRPVAIGTSGTNARLWVDSVSDPGTYRYRVSGIDLFGRKGQPSVPCSWIDAFPPPPSAPVHVRAEAVDRLDSRAKASEVAKLPAGVDFGVRLSWEWTENLERTCPDVVEFQLYGNSGLPDALLGTIGEGVRSASDGFEVILKLDTTASVSANELAGRQVVQKGRSFWILSHDGGAAATGVKALLKRHEEPSSNVPLPGSIAVPLSAKIPVHLEGAHSAAAGSTVRMKTSAFLAMPAAGLDGTTLVAGRGRAVLSGSTFDVTTSTITARLSESLDEIAEAGTRGVPYVASLELNELSSGLQKDWSAPASWEHDFTAGNGIAKTGSSYSILFREALQGEALGLTRLSNGEEVFVLPRPFEGFRVDTSRLIASMHFGIRSVSPTAEGRIGHPAKMMRILRDVSGLPGPALSPASSADRLADQPGFDGKSSTVIQWPHRTNCSFQVFRATAESLFAEDLRVRKRKGAGWSARFDDAQKYQTWLGGFPASLRPLIESQIIQPRWNEIDGESILADSQHNLLLQALGGLPENDRAFSELKLDSSCVRLSGSGNQAIQEYEDRTLEGRAAAVYLYRIRFVDGVGNRGALGLPLEPVHVRTVPMPPPPLFSKTLADDRSVSLEWAVDPSADVRAYRVYRTTDRASCADLRLMSLAYEVSLSSDLTSRPQTLTWRDASLPGLVPHFYRLACVDREGYIRQPGPVATVTPYDVTPPVVPTPAVAWASSAGGTRARITWISTEDTLLQKRARANLPWLDVTPWKAPGSHEILDARTEATRRYEYRLRARKRTTGAIAEGTEVLLVP